MPEKVEDNLWETVLLCFENISKIISHKICKENIQQNHIKEYVNRERFSNKSGSVHVDILTASQQNVTLRDT